MSCNIKLTKRRFWKKVRLKQNAKARDQIVATKWLRTKLKPNLQMPQSLQWYCPLSIYIETQHHNQTRWQFKTNILFQRKESNTRRKEKEQSSHRRRRICTLRKSTPPYWPRNLRTLAPPTNNSASLSKLHYHHFSSRLRSKLTGCSVSQITQITCKRKHIQIQFQMPPQQQQKRKKKKGKKRWQRTNKYSNKKTHPLNSLAIKLVPIFLGQEHHRIRPNKQWIMISESSVRRNEWVRERER